MAPIIVLSWKKSDRQNEVINIEADEALQQNIDGDNSNNLKSRICQ